MTQPRRRWQLAAVHLVLLALCAGAASCDRRPALHRAVAPGNEAAVAQALDAGADPNAVDSRGDTALHLAARLPHASGMVVMLLRAGADVNASNRQGWTPLHQTLEPATAQTLIDHGGDLRAVDRCGSTPLHTATSGWIMVEPRPGLSASRQAEAESAAAAEQRLLDGLRQQVVRVLLENGADPNSPNAVGYTPLHRAAQEGHLEEVRLLLAYGADPLAKDHSGETVLEMATRHGHAAMAQLLQQRVGEMRHGRSVAESAGG